MNDKKIVLNQIRTPDGTILRSMHRHDFTLHKDANGLTYMVDGGNDYLHRNVHESAPYEELTVYSDAPFEVIRESFHRGGRGKDGTQPLTWTPLHKMSNPWLENCIIYNEKLGMADSFPSKMYAKELEYREKNNIYITDSE